MSEIIGTVISNYEPPKDKFWLNGKVLKYYGANGWESITSLDKEILWDDIKNKPTFSKVATSGSYNDLNNKPTPYTLPAATLAALGGIKKSAAIADLASDADLPTVVAKINTLLAAFRASGILNA